MATRGKAVAVGGGPSLWFWLGLAAIVILADQMTKTLIIGEFKLGDSRPVTDFFNIVRAHNTGAAFSFLANAGGWQRWFFVGLGFAASGFIVWMLRSHPSQKLFCFAVTMILGGALGNVIDRLLHGYVVDFLQFRFNAARCHCGQSAPRERTRHPSHACAPGTRHPAEPPALG